MSNEPAATRHRHARATSSSIRFALLLAELLLPAAANATTVVLPADEALATQAAAVVRGEVISSQATATGPLRTVTVLRVLETVAGRTGETITFSLPGGVRSNGPSLWLPGIPRFSAGEHLTVFFATDPQGNLQPWHLGLGIFREVATVDGIGLVRELDDVRVLAREGGETNDVVRHRDRFLGWVRDHRAGAVRTADYAIAAPARLPQANVFSFQGKLLRWAEFDRNVGVPFYVARRPQPGANDQFASARRAFAAWNADAATPVRFQFAGRTTATTGFLAFDGVNTVLFDAPEEQGLPAFDCAVGGVLAIGGPWFRSDNAVPRGSFEFLPTLGADVMFNRGTGCVWRFFGDLGLEETLAHELGHTLGLAHSCGDAATGSCAGRPAADAALMRAFVHFDKRGAALEIDDRRGLRFLYGRPPV